MDLVGVAYTSVASRPMPAVELDRLLASARANNSLVGVTGVLLYGHGQFFQYFEGERAGVDEVWERIVRSSLHHQVIELQRQPIAQRAFNRWFMGFREAPGSVLQQLSHEQWARELPWLDAHAEPSPGMAHLLDLVA